ncbi:TetR/AcrR family transcriptional regulator [Corynebacterium sp. YIM 101645]|uniref:TetR/AcrR family transcriptional regulator n=1 Tax=Corynebacterium lemuris TaxID=1859292 RepID=A0ABT2FX73_9CORY|nr:TetR/AcrR family transcriptional regulator [Corynebacterium lemuris]MCS5479604.1 TetR/AcrR family transcriptional regulator [Corynebacterium lemuris]
MRRSRREHIIDAAVALIAADGLEAVSFEALAEAAGLSKSGIIYHFPSRHELMLGIHRHLAQAWEVELERIAGARAAELSQAQRLRAVVISMGRTAELPELLMVLDARNEPEYKEVWAGVDKRWMPEPDSSDAYLVQLIAYGLWAHDHVHHEPLQAADRKRLIAAALEQIPT